MEKLKVPNLQAGYVEGVPEFLTTLPSKMPTFEEAKASVLSFLMQESPDSGMHAMWINCKIAAVKNLKSEADLATAEQAAAAPPFDAHVEMSAAVRRAMAN